MMGAGRDWADVANKHSIFLGDIPTHISTKFRRAFEFAYDAQLMHLTPSQISLRLFLTHWDESMKRAGRKERKKGKDDGRKDASREVHDTCSIRN